MLEIDFFVSLDYAFCNMYCLHIVTRIGSAYTLLYWTLVN